jgi:dihydrofolate synthase/folylpolyglutamate synthase
MRFNTLSDWLAWQEQLHPASIDLGLERVEQVWQRLHSSYFDCPVISVAGTNGKGSSVAMLQSIYQAAGYKTASYTSPHLLKYNERICINGKPVDDGTLCHAFERIDQARDQVSLTYFEFGTLAALDIFKQEMPDVVILEVGMGGRLDAVNLVDADVALITQIDLDHQQWLGTDRETIAIEKAGILRSGRPGVVSDQDAPASLQQAADAIGAQLYVINDAYYFRQNAAQWEWQYSDRVRAGLPLPALNGQHQLQNAAGVLMVVELLSASLPVKQADLRKGLLAARQPGRFTILPGHPACILDVAHNPAAVATLVASLRQYTAGKHLHVVFACLADKDIAQIIKPLCLDASNWYLAQLDEPRAANVSQLQKELLRICPAANFSIHSSVADALNTARQAGQPDELVLVYGSFYTVAEAMKESI